MIREQTSAVSAAESGCVVRLVAERQHCASGSVGPAAILELPSGPSWLSLPDAGVPILSSDAPVAGAASVRLEPVHPSRRSPRVLLLAAAPGHVTVNDRRAGRFSVLTERDQFRLDASVLFHLTLFTRPRLGPPAESILNKECPVCRVPFTEGTIAFHCGCGSGLHAEGLEPDDSLLQCARAVSACPRCSQPIVLTEGYAWFPPEVSHA